MRVKRAHEDPLKNQADLIVVPLEEREWKAYESGKKKRSDRYRWLVSLAGKDFVQELSLREFTGKKLAEGLLCASPSDQCRYVLIVGWSDKDDQRFRHLGHRIGTVADRIKASSVYLHLVCSTQEEYHLQGLLEELSLSSYAFTYYKKKSTKHAVSTMSLLDPPKNITAIAKAAKTAADAVTLARDLVNLPAGVCTPSYFVRRVRSVLKGTGLRVKVYNKAALTKLKAGGILGVGQGSAESPYLVTITYTPKNRKRYNKVALVGKGVTFDTGGNSIKPAGSMMAMKCDMAGAAAVFASMKAIAETAPAVEVRAYIPLAENMVSGNAIRPGDVLRILNGTTVEVLNTDAEGRLILADALSLAVKEKPDVILDAATLTGSCVVALGETRSGLFSNDESLQAILKECGALAGEQHWPMPLAEDCRGQLKSSVADTKNIGGRWGGAITAALFLEKFTGDVPWAHFDIAGPAFLEGGKHYLPGGATGFMVRTFLEFADSGAKRFFS